MRRWAAGAVLVVYLVGMVMAVGWPDGWAVNRLIVRVHYRVLGLGVPLPWGPDTSAVLLNVLACIPPVALAVVLLPRVRWWWWVLVALLLSVAVELTQGLIGRRTEVSDVVANTVGALLGGLLGDVLLRRPRDRPVDKGERTTQ